MIVPKKYAIPVSLVVLLSLNAQAMQLDKQKEEKDALQNTWVKYGLIGSAIAAVGTLAYYWYRTERKPKEAIFLDAVKRENVSGVQELLKNGYEMDLESKSSEKNPLYYVAGCGSEKMMNTFLEYIDHRSLVNDEIKVKALENALCCGNLGVAELFLKHNKQLMNKICVYHLAKNKVCIGEKVYHVTPSSFVKKIFLLHKYGFDFEKLDCEYGITLLHACVERFVTCRYDSVGHDLHTSFLRRKDLNHSCECFFYLQTLKEEENKCVEVLLLCLKNMKLKIPKYVLLEIIKPIYFFSNKLLSMQDRYGKTADDRLMAVIRNLPYRLRSRNEWNPYEFHEKERVLKIRDLIKPRKK